MHAVIAVAIGLLRDEQSARADREMRREEFAGADRYAFGLPLIRRDLPQFLSAGIHREIGDAGGGSQDGVDHQRGVSLHVVVDLRSAGDVLTCIGRNLHIAFQINAADVFCA